MDFSSLKAELFSYVSSLDSKSFYDRGNPPYYLVTAVTVNGKTVQEESFGGFFLPLDSAADVDHIASQAHRLTSEMLDRFSKKRAVMLNDPYGFCQVLYPDSDHLIVITVVAHRMNADYLCSRLMSCLQKHLGLTK